MPYFVNCDLLQLPMTSAYCCTLFTCDQHVMTASKFTQCVKFLLSYHSKYRLVQAFAVTQHAKQARVQGKYVHFTLFSWPDPKPQLS